MRKIAPGVYDDGDGGMHIDLTEMLTAHGYADTPENREMLLGASREMASRVGATLTVTNDRPDSERRIYTPPPADSDEPLDVVEQALVGALARIIVKQIRAEAAQHALLAEAFVIWSFEHRAWWGPGKMGYTEDLAAAGRYTKGEADTIVAHANRYAKTMQEIAMPVADAVSFHPPMKP